MIVNNRNLRLRRRIVAGSLGLSVALVGIAGPADATAAVKFKQPACGKYQAQVRTLTGAKKRAANAKLKQCRANMKVYKQVRNSHFVGYRSDDVKVDTIYCGNGKWQDDVGVGGDVAVQGWRVVGAKVSRDGKRLTGIVEAWIPGGTFVQAVKKDGGQWQIGWEFNGKGNAYGDMEKTNAVGVCAAL